MLTLAPLHGQAPAPNRVLELDGRGAYAELPAQAFDGLVECTIEGWVKWASYRYWSRFFDVGRGSWEGFNVGQAGILPQLSFFYCAAPDAASDGQIHAPGILRPGEWGHIALVVDRQKVTLLYNGHVVAAGQLEGGLSSLPVKERFVLGRNNWGTFGAPGVVRPDETQAAQASLNSPTQYEGRFEDLHGQIDEVRLWRVARSADEIRRTLSARLTGSEPDLIALWSFDDGSARDATGRHHGEFRRGACAMEAPFPTIDAHTRLQPVLHLDGFNSYAELPADMIRGLKESTVEAWIRCSALQRAGEGRFFEWGGSAGQTFSLAPGLWGADAEAAILFTMVGGPTGWTFHNAWAKNAIRPDRWFHVAAVSGVGGMSLHLNGVLVASNSYPGSFANLQLNGPVLLGKTTDTNQPSVERTFRGDLTDVRVWDRSRTGEEIRRDMFKQLEGQEPGLVALWDFADGSANDRSPSRRHGQIRGNGTVLSRRLPRPDELERPAVLILVAVDDRDNALPGAQFDLLQGGLTVASVTLDEVSDNKQLVLYPNGRPYDLWARRAGLGAAIRDLEIAPGEGKALRLELKPTGAIGGTVRTFDGSAQVATVVQAVGQDGNVRGTAVTDGVGNYRIEDLPLGDYYLRCHVLGGFRFYAGADTSVFQAGTNRVEPPPANAWRTPVLPGRTEQADFRFAPFKKGTWRSYTSLDGLAANFVMCLVQAEDGALWLGTGGGVSRFDGVGFTTFKQEDGLRDNQIFHMLARPDGTVWFAGVSGVSRGRREGAGFRFERLPFPQGWTVDGNGGRPELASADGQGVRIVGGNGIWSAEGTAVHPVARIPGLRNHTRGPDGSLWLGTTNSTVWQLQGTNLTSVDLSPYFGTNGVNRVARARDGSLWCQTLSADRLSRTIPGALAPGDKGGLTRLVPAPDGSFRRQRFTRKEGLLSDDLWTVVTEGDSVWCTYREAPGATRFEGDTIVHFAEADGLPNAPVNDLLTDRDGAIWFATGAGVVRWDPNTFIHFRRQDGLPGDHVWVSHPATNGVLVCAGQSPGGWGLLRPGRDTHFDPLETGPGNISATWNLAADGQGGLWLPLWSGGVGHFDGQALRRMPESEGWPAGDVFCVAASPGGELWIAHAAGVSRHRPTTRPTERARFDDFPQAVLGPIEPAQALGCDTEGSVWVGFDGGGVVRFDGRTFHPAAANEGVLPGLDVFRIVPDRDGSVWFATEAGVTRHAHGRFESFSARHPALRNKRARTIIRDRDGVLWFGTDAGVVRFDGRVWSTLDSRDGLAGNEVRWIAEDADGRFWFGADKGLTRYERTSRTPAAPRLVVETDRGPREIGTVIPVTKGELLRFRLETTDLTTRPETRRFIVRHWTGRRADDEALLSDRWELLAGPDYTWRASQSGAGTLAFRYVDRDLNYSQPVFAHIEAVLPWYQNGRILVPGAFANLALGAAAVVSTVRSRRRKREAQRLREQLYAEERKARAAAEAARRDVETSALALAAKNSQLDAARQAADTANTAKSRFLASLSHELRTPLNAVIGYSELLEEEAPEIGAQAMVPALQKVQAAARHQLGLINDILDLSKIEAGKMTVSIEEFDVGSLVREVEAMVQPLVAKQANQLVVECPPGIGSMRTDQTKLRQVLFNLISNAAKFTERGTLRLEVNQAVGPTESAPQQTAASEGHSSGNEPSPLISFRIVDTGIGMSAAQLGKLFQDYAQADADTWKKYGGTGLGLALSRRFAQMLGGDLTVTSELSRGSTFTLALPRMINISNARLGGG